MATAHDHQDELIAIVQQYIEEGFDQTIEFADKANTSAQGFTNYQYTPVDWAPLDSSEDFSDIAEVERFSGQFNPEQVFPEIPEYKEVSIPELEEFPDAPEALDTSDLFDFDRPAFDVGPLEAEAPTVNTDFPFPDAPTIRTPDEPENLSDSDEYTPPDVDVPAFTAQFNGVAPQIPANLANTYDETYEQMLPEIQESIRCQLEDWIDRYAPNFRSIVGKTEDALCKALEGRETFLADGVEERIFNRARSRAEAERERAERDLIDNYERRGYDCPPGVVMGGLNKIQIQTSRQVSDAAAQTAIERAKLEAQFYTTMVQAGFGYIQSLRNNLIEYARLGLQEMQIASELARERLKALIDAYTLMVRIYEVEASVYRTQAQVYEVQLEAAFAQLKVFQAKLDAIKTRTDVEKALIDKFIALISAEKSKVDIYATQVSAVSETIRAEKLKVDIFGEQVRAYAAQIGAKEAEFRAYGSAIDGDRARVDAYRAEVGAYESQISAARSKIDAAKTRSDATISYNRNLNELFDAKIRLYGTQLESEGKIFDSQLDAYKAALERYDTTLKGRLASIQNKYAAEEINARVAITDAELRMQELRIASDKWQAQSNLRTNTFLGTAQLMAQVASGALESQNAIIGVIETSEA